MISSVDAVSLLGIKIDNQLNFEKHVSTIISCYIFLSRQYSLLYTSFYIANVLKYLPTLSKIKNIYILLLILYKICIVLIRCFPSLLELTYMLL